MRVSTLALATALISGTLAYAKTPAPLIPDGKWTLTQQRLSCAVSLAYGTGPTAQTLGLSDFRRHGIDKISIVSADGHSGPSWRSDVSVTIGKGQAIAMTAHDTLQSDRKWLTEIFPAKGDVIVPPQADTLTVRFGTDPAVTFTLPNAQAGMAMLNDCRNVLDQKWGIDRANDEAIASGSGPLGRPEDWITTDDYPVESKRNKEEGTSIILWHIGIDGLASDCRIVESSGHPLLDQAACGAIVRRARYAPALDINRKPLPSWSSRNVIWSLPK